MYVFRHLVDGISVTVVPCAFIFKMRGPKKT